MKRIHLCQHSLSRAICAAILWLVACRHSSHQKPMLNDDLAGRYVVLASEVGQDDPDSLDFYVPRDRAKTGLPTNVPSLPVLHTEAASLLDDLHEALQEHRIDPVRGQFLLRQVDSTLFRIEQLQGRRRSFDDESRALFGIEAGIDTGAENRKSLRKKLANVLGNPRSLANAYSRYDAQFIVSPERLPSVLNTALQRCRELTLRHIPLPTDEQVRVEYVSQKPWSAFSRYLGDSISLIQVNTDYPLTVDRILNLACHEGYPGHHVFNVLRDAALVRDGRRDEFRVQPTFSPQSYVSEAAATYAPTLLLSDEERTRLERDVLFPLAGLKPAAAKRYVEVEKLIGGLHTAEPAIARDYLDEHLEFTRAAEALEREMLMQHSEITLLYLNEFRTYVLTYTVGSDQIRKFVESGHPTEAERWQRYLLLIRDPNALASNSGRSSAAAHP